MSCMSWLWLMFPSRLCKPPSPVRQKGSDLGLPGARVDTHGAMGRLGALG